MADTPTQSTELPTIPVVAESVAPTSAQEVKAETTPVSPATKPVVLVKPAATPQPVKVNFDSKALLAKLDDVEKFYRAIVKPGFNGNFYAQNVVVKLRNRLTAEDLTDEQKSKLVSEINALTKDEKLASVANVGKVATVPVPPPRN